MKKSVNSKKVNAKKARTRKLVIIALSVVLVITAAFTFFFAKKLLGEKDIENKFLVSAKKYMEDYGIVFNDSISIPMSILKDENYISKVAEKCIANSYVIVKKVNNNYQYEAIINCDEAKNIIQLNGDTKITVEVGENYLEEGATVIGDNNQEIIIENTVNTSKKGIYALNYTIPGADPSVPPAIRIVEVVDLKAPVISLKDSDVIYLVLGDKYEEAGYKAIDNYDGDITKNVKVSGSVNTKKPGTYQVTYKVSDSSNNETVVTRTIIVRDNIPTITLKGYATMYVEIGSNYVDPGYTALDLTDGNLTKNVTISGSVNTQRPGTYVITYTIRNSKGGVATVRRTVIVQDMTKPTITLNGNKEITLEWGKDSYQEFGAIATDNYDGEITSKIQITGIFNPDKLGTYYLTYMVRDSSGNTASVQRIIKVVDRIAPTISLKGDMTQYVEAGTTYVDPGYIANDNYDSKVSVTTNTNLNMNGLGTYTITYIAKDTSGNTTTVERTVIVQDKTNPIITLNGNATLYIELGQNYQELGATATDNFDSFVSKKIVIDASGVNTKVSGTYEVTYNVEDANGNKANTVVRTVIVRDTIAPTITLASSSVDKFISKAIVEVLIHDEGSTLQNVKYAWTNSVNTPDNYTEWAEYIDNTKMNLEITTDGIYYLHVSASDETGNVKTNVIGPFKIDTMAPTVVFTPNGSNGHSITTSVKATDSNSGIASIGYAWSSDKDNVPSEFTKYENEQNLTLSEDGTYYLWVKAVDNAGNETITVSEAFVVDNAYPTISFEPTTSIVSKELTSTVSLEALDGKTITFIEYVWSTSTTEPTTGWTSWDIADYEMDKTLTMPQGEDGTYYLWVRVTDSLGLTSIASSNAYKQDTTDPTVSITPNGSEDTKQIEIAVSVVEENKYSVWYVWSTESDITKVQLEKWEDYSSDKNTLTFGEENGTYYLHIMILDEAGNSVQMTSLTYVLDNISPEKPVISGNTDWTNEDIEITITGDEELQYSFDLENWTTYDESNKPMISENETTIYARSKDKAGNVSEVVSTTFTNLDKELPSLTVDFEGGIMNKLEIPYSITDKISGLASLKYGFSTSKEVEPNYDYEVTLENSKDQEGTIIAPENLTTGTHYVWVKVVDNAGNTTVVVTEEIIFDKTAPEITIRDENGTTGPVNKETTTVDITDDGEIDTIEYVWSTSTLKPVSGWTSWNNYAESSELTIGNNNEEDGVYYLHVQTTDKAGNTTYVVSNGFIIVNGNPEITFTPETNLDYAKTIESIVSASFDLGEITSLEYAWSIDENTVPTSWTTFTSGDTITLADETGAYYLYVRVKDNVNGERITIIKSNGTFNIDNTEPTVTYAPNGSTETLHKAEVTLDVKDNHSGMNSVKYAWSYDNSVSPNADDFKEYTPGSTITYEPEYGIYYLWVMATDTAGNSKATVSNGYRIDNAYPEITFTPNKSTPVNELTIDVEALTSEGKTIKQIYYAWDTKANADENTVWVSWDDYSNESNRTLSKTGENGIYYLHVKVVDSNDLTTIQSTEAIVFDNLAPTITMDPEATDIQKQVEVTINVTELNDYKVWYVWSTEVDESLVTYEEWADFMGNGNDVAILGANNEEDGIYYLYIKVVDAAGNTTKMVSNPYSIDNTAPEIPVISIDTTWTNKGVEIILSGEDQLQYSFDTILWVNYDENNRPKVIENNVTVYARSKDKAGNMSEISQVTVENIDNIAPMITVTPSTLDYTNQNLKMKVNVEEGGSPIVDVRWAPGIRDISLFDDESRGNKVPLATMTFDCGENRDYTVYVKDAAGNASIYIGKVTNIDKTAPIITIDSTEVEVAQGSEYDIFAGVTATDNVGFGNNQLTATEFTTTVVGTYEVVYSITDMAGNTTTVSKTIHVVDKTAPSISLNGDSNITIEVGTKYEDLGVTVTDNVDALDDIIINITNPVDTAVIGTYTITYLATDKSGNVSEEIIRTVTVVDTTAPSISLNGDSNITIEVGTKYEDEGVTYSDNYNILEDLTLTTTGSVDTTILGTYTIKYQVTDKSGNASEEITRIVTVVDTTAPSISLNGDSNITIEVGTRYEDEGVTYSDNYNTLEDLTLTTTGSVDTTILGTYTIKYQVTDKSGNVSEEITRTVTVVDTTAPSIDLNGDSNITIEAGTRYEDEGVTYSDNYNTLEDLTLTTTGSVDTTILGTYTIKYQVTDKSGNVSEEITRTVTVVDTTAPSIDLNGDSNITIEVGTKYEDLGVTLSDNFTPTNKIILTVTGSVDTNILGTYTITYTAQDENGNSSREVRTVTVVDTTAPVITIQGEKDITIEVGSTYIDLGAIVTDNYDKNISVIINNTVDTTITGDYTVTYTAQDSSNNKAITVTRTVHVVETDLMDRVRDDNSCPSIGSCYSQTNATNNYVWYSGYLWRIVKVNGDDTIKLVTQDTISAFSYDNDSSSYPTSVLNNWLQTVFYPSLHNADNLVSQAANWCYEKTTNSANERTTCAANALIQGKIGLLSLDEYNIIGGNNSFLNTGDRYFTMTPSDSDTIWTVFETGEAKNGQYVYNTYGVRPSISLNKEAVILSGDGSINNPYHLQEDTKETTPKELNKQYSGEYVTFAGKTWRIVSSTTEGTKLVMDSYFEDENGLVEIAYGDTNIFSTNTGIGNYLNTVVYNTLFTDSETKLMLNTLWYEGSYNFGFNPVLSSLITTGNYTTAKVGLLRVGELLAANSSTFNNNGYTYWTMSKYESKSQIWHISSVGSAYMDTLQAPRALRPVIELKPTVIITSGEGTVTNPYVIR